MAVYDTDDVAREAFAGLLTLCESAEADSDLAEDVRDGLTAAAPNLIPGWILDLHQARLTLFPVGMTPGPARAGPKVGRNDPCPCGSGRKYKKCCGVS